MRGCGVCGFDSAELVYQGNIRDGVFGKHKQGRISECSNCNVQRLGEEYCLDNEDYVSGDYRESLGQDKMAENHYAVHDKLQKFALDVLWPKSLRGATVADIGAASGSFLDQVSGVIKKGIAIDPALFYHERLKSKGYDVFSFTEGAHEEWSGKVDLATSFHVIEHVSDPVAFLKDIRKLLSKDGSLLISTPNRKDILKDLLPDDFPSFFYRAAHRWYFDESSLRKCSEIAGFDVEEVKYKHRYNMANALNWLRYKRPTGWEGISKINELADDFWRSYLEANGTSDTLFILLKKKDELEF